MKRLNVLLSAYACRPNMGSEPGVGWNTACEMANHEQVWVITRKDNSALIEAELQANPYPNLQFIYCDVPAWIKIWCNSGTLLHYYIWQLCAYITIKQLLPQLELDLIHHVTYVRYSSPSFLAFLSIPFIWGSVGGGEATPKAFWKDFGIRARWYEWVRSTVHWLGEQDPFTRITAKKSALVLATTEDTACRLRHLAQVEVKVFPESALAPKEIEMLGQYPEAPKQPLRFISIARLLHWKGLHLGIRGFAAANLLPNTEYWICGEGPERESLEGLTDSLGMREYVKFLGRRPRDETLERLSQCHALIHPSLHDSGGWVCIEAMAIGRPVICLNLGGPSTQVSISAGFTIPAENPNQVVSELATILTRLSREESLRQQMGKAGKDRVNTLYNWQNRSRYLAKTYREILTQSN